MHKWNTLPQDIKRHTHSNRSPQTQMQSRTAGTLWKMMGLVGYQDAIYYVRLHVIYCKSIMHQDGPKQATTAYGYEVSCLPNVQRDAAHSCGVDGMRRV